MRFIDTTPLFSKFSSLKPSSQLIFLLALFATALLLPLGFLAQHVYSELADNRHYDYQWNAEQVVKQTNKIIDKILTQENDRPFADYQFYKWVADPLTNKKEKTKSPLAHYDQIKHIPGYIGHFQVDSEDNYCSPILPYIERKHLNRGAGMEWSEITDRLDRQAYIKELLISNGLLKVSRSELSKPVDSTQTLPLSPERSKKAESQPRKEESYSTTGTNRESWQPNKTDDSYTAFLVEIDPFQWKRGDTGHYFFYRKVWRQSKLYVQGFVVDENKFLEGIIAPGILARKFDTDVTLNVFNGEHFTQAFLLKPAEEEHNRLVISNSLASNSVTSKTATSNTVNSKIITAKKIVSNEKKSTTEAKGILRASLEMPLDQIKLSFSTPEISMGPEASLVNILLLTVTSVIGLGVYALYRTGNQQIKLAEERLNFVSSVSHELKTPLTSILMYSEMLKEGMVRNKEKQQNYFDFIFFESERLSRLISNVLQLSSLEKNTPSISISACTVSQLQNLVHSKTSTLIETNNFKVNFQLDNIDTSSIDVLVDQDVFTQIAINLIDNAIKFSVDKDQPEASHKRIDIGFRASESRSDRIVFYVRDYGPGIQAEQAHRVFDLFYRIGSELTRVKPGTGIGLALVKELSNAMNGSVEIINRNPGAEFCVTLPARLTG